MDTKIALGSVQFGMDYGITNKLGKVDSKEIKSILSLANLKNITFIDTAQAYGNAEKKIGELCEDKSNLYFISKLKPQNTKKYNFSMEEKWEQEFQRTLSNLKVKNLDAFLVHNPNDISNENSDFLLNWLKNLKKRNLVKRIGISIYHDTNINNLPLREIDLIQLPLSLYDQRLLSNGTVKKLYDLNISIHSRSIFLQGLLLENSLNWPKNINQDFIYHHKKLENFLNKRNISLLDAALSFQNKCKYIEAFLVGVLSCNQLSNILNSWKSINKKDPLSNEQLLSWSWNNEKDLDPRFWNK